jgi:hypothetical protein
MNTVDTIKKLMDSMPEVKKINLSELSVSDLNQMISKVHRAEVTLETDATREDMIAALTTLLEVGRIDKNGTYMTVPELSYEYIKSKFKSLYGK